MIAELITTIIGIIAFGICIAIWLIINKREMNLALISAINATANGKTMAERYSRIDPYHCMACNKWFNKWQIE